MDYPKTYQLIKEIEEHKRQMDLLFDEIVDIQTNCPHINMKTEAGQMNNHLERLQWFDCKCADCLKQWRVYEDDEGYEELVNGPLKSIE